MLLEDVFTRFDRALALLERYVESQELIADIQRNSNAAAMNFAGQMLDVIAPDRGDDG